MEYRTDAKFAERARRFIRREACFWYPHTWVNAREPQDRNVKRKLDR